MPNLLNLSTNVKSLVEYVNRTKKLSITLKNDIEVRFDSKYIMVDSVPRNFDVLKEADDECLASIVDLKKKYPSENFKKSMIERSIID